MPYSVKIIKDSLAPNGKRLTTFELSFPKFLQAEFNTHRMLSRNSASSRAIPIAKMIQMVRSDPVMPLWWGKNQSGMQALEELSSELEYREDGKGKWWKNDGHTHCSQKDVAIWIWKEGWYQSIGIAERLAAIGLHKQICNRILEPFMFTTVVATATEWANFFHLRNHKDAQPELAFIAKQMQEQYEANQPKAVPVGYWHLPYIDEEDYRAVDPAIAVSVLKKVSVGRCARVSYLTHDGKRDLEKDIELHDKLLAGELTDDPLHMSPFEHIAMAMDKPERSGNFFGWFQYRKSFKNEHFGGPMP